MTAQGDAVLAMARSQIGVTESPAGSNNVPYWDWYGGNYGSWCACFVSWCDWHAGYPCCAIDSAKGFILVSNGTVHSYPEGEALPTDMLYPGCTVLFSWYPWSFVGGVPTITDGGEWDGWIAGDHTGIFAYWIDRGSGQFACVEGNTSQSSWDNGGAVLERTDRFTSQVCGWWEPPAMSNGWPPDVTPVEEDEDLEPMMRYIVRAEDGSAYAVDGIKAHPISSEQNVHVLQATGAMMTRAQMEAKGYTVDLAGDSIQWAFEVQPITENVRDQQ